jgi:hypothetical protein
MTDATANTFMTLFRAMLMNPNVASNRNCSLSVRCASKSRIESMSFRPAVHSKVAILRYPETHELQRIMGWLDTLPASGSRFEDLAVLWVERLEMALGANGELHQCVAEPYLFQLPVQFRGTKGAQKCKR